MTVKSIYVTLRRRDVNKILARMTLSEYGGVLHCPICRHAQKRKEAYEGIRKHEKGCAVKEIERALEYDYEQ